MYIRKLLFILILSITSCIGSNKNKDLQTFLGSKESEVILELGIPAQHNLIHIDRQAKLLEYQSSLYDYLTQNNIDRINIKESIWKDNHVNTVIWFVKDVKHNWIVIDGLRWSNNIKY